VTRYEDILFGVMSNDPSLYGGRTFGGESMDVGVGRSSPSSAEMVLKFLSTRFPKSAPTPILLGPGPARAPAPAPAAAAAAAAAAHLEALEEMRREFTRAMVLQKHQRHELQARDELVMCTTRIRVRLPHEAALGGLPDPIPPHLRASVGSHALQSNSNLPTLLVTLSILIMTCS
jgi:E3 ubiquitin-protein ligase SHPRH